MATRAANDNDLLRLAAANDNGPGDPTILRIAPGGDWKIVRFLKPGDQIRTALNGRVARDANGELSLIEGPGNDLLTVVSVELDRSPRQVYNFEVADLHSYAVGPLGEWVHNAAGRRPSKGDKADAIGKGDHCFYCGTPLTTAVGKPNSCEWDHMVPWARGGKTVPENLAAACRTCNRSKGSKPWWEFVTRH